MIFFLLIILPSLVEAMPHYERLSSAATLEEKVAYLLQEKSLHDKKNLHFDIRLVALENKIDSRSEEEIINEKKTFVLNVLRSSTHLVISLIMLVISLKLLPSAQTKPINETTLPQQPSLMLDQLQQEGSPK